MTVPTSDNREQYEGNGAATAFDYAFKVFRADDLVVVLTASDGTETTLTRGTDYSVDGVGEEAGGTVTYPLSGDPLATGETLTLLREVPVVQETDLRNQGAYYPETLEDEFDRSRMIDQQQQETLARTLKKTRGGEHYDAGGARIRNLGDAEDDSDALTSKQMKDYYATIRESVERANDFIEGAEYQYLGDYEGGITVEHYNQLLRDTNGEFWRVSGSTDLPYTTDGTGMPEGGAFVAVGDAVLRQELADPAKGGELVKATTSTGEQTLAEALDGRVIYVDTIADLQALDTEVGQTVYLTQEGRAGEFVFRSGDQSTNVTNDTQEGIWIAPDADPTGVSGAFERQVYDYVTPAMFGAAQDGVTGDSAAINAFLSSGYNLVGEEGTELLLDSPITIPEDICFDANYSKWIKGFNGDSIEKFGRRSVIKNLEIDGNGINYSGRGVVIDIGGRANYEDLGQQKMFNCTLRNSRGREVDYVGAYRGTLSQLVGCKFFPLPVSDGGGGVAVAWPNEPIGNGNRHIRDCYCAGILLFDQGCDNGIVAFNTVGATTTQPSVLLNNDSKKIIFTGNRFAHGATNFEVRGTQHSFSGNIFSSTVSFSSTALNVSFDSSNVSDGLSGIPPFKDNRIDFGEASITYPIAWSSDGTQPAFGNADVRALYTVRGKFVRVSVQIIFGSTTTFGTGSYTFTLPPVSTTASKFVTGSGWLAGYSLTALATPINGTINLYYDGTTLNNASPVTLANGDRLVFDIEYEVQ